MISALKSSYNNTIKRCCSHIVTRRERTSASPGPKSEFNPNINAAFFLLKINTIQTIQYAPIGQICVCVCVLLQVSAWGYACERLYAGVERWYNCCLIGIFREFMLIHAQHIGSSMKSRKPPTTPFRKKNQEKKKIVGGRGPIACQWNSETATALLSH